MFDLQTVILIMSVAALAAFVQGYAGFGYGVLSMTIFSFLALDIERASVVVTLISLAVMGLLFFLSRPTSKMVWKRILLIMCGALIGSPLGYWFIVVYGKQPLFNVVFGIVLLYFSASGILSPHLRRRIHAVLAVGIGTVAGFISGAFVSGGPPVVLYLYSQTGDPREMKASLQAVFFMMSVYRLILVGAGGIGYSKEMLLVSLCAIPAVAAALLVGHALSRRTSAELFRKTVYALLGLIGIILLGRGLRGLFV